MNCIKFLTLYVLLAVFNPRPLYFTSSHVFLVIYNFYLSGLYIYIFLYIFHPLFWRDLYWYTSPSNLHPFTATHPSTIFILQFTTVSWSLRVFVSSGMSFYYSWNMGNKFLTQKIFDWNEKVGGGVLWKSCGGTYTQKENGSWIN